MFTILTVYPQYHSIFRMTSSILIPLPNRFWIIFDVFFMVKQWRIVLLVYVACKFEWRWKTVIRNELYTVRLKINMYIVTLENLIIIIV